MSASPSPRRSTDHVSGATEATPLRVLHLLPGNNGMTGVETFVLQLCAAQQRDGLVPAICLDLDGREAVGEAGARMGVAVHPYPGWAVGGFAPVRKIANAALRLRRIRRLATLLRGADVLHIHAVGIAGLEGLLAAKLVRTRSVVVTHHATLTYFAPMWSRESDLTFWLERRVASWSVMPYTAASEELIALGIAREQAAVIPFCVDERRFGGRAPSPEAGGPLRLVMAARMCEGKGQLELLDAVALLRERHLGVRLVLVGDGPMRRQVEESVDRLTLREVVEVRGQVRLDEMPRIYGSSHLVVLPSHMPGETFPLCLLEGMAMGLPAVGTRWFGIPDIIADGETGFVVEPRDPRTLAAAIERFLSDPGLHAAMGERAAERVRRCFTGAAVSRAYQALYAQPLPGRTPTDPRRPGDRARCVRSAHPGA